MTRDAADGIAVVKVVLPYLLDLGSTNGTFLNAERIEAHRYVEVRASAGEWRIGACRSRWALTGFWPLKFACVLFFFPGPVLQLREGDTLKFGNSSREFVLLNEQSTAATAV